MVKASVKEWESVRELILSLAVAQTISLWLIMQQSPRKAGCYNVVLNSQDMRVIVLGQTHGH